MASEEKFLEKVKQRYKEAVDNEATNRQLWLEDMRFAHVPGSQWPEAVRRMREMPPSPRPCLEINVLAQHIYQITNDIRQNRPTIKVRPVGLNASGDVAEVFDGVIRHIDACSDSDIATDVAVNCAVGGGFGYFRITTEYIDKSKNEQGIYCKPCHNPLSISLDPNAMCPVGSDAEWAIVMDEMGKEKFNATYGEDAGKWTGDNTDSGWVTKNSVRVAEYFEKTTTSKNVMKLYNNQEITETEYWTQYQGDIERPGILSNEIVNESKVRWWKICDKKILEGGKEGMEFPSQYIPIIRVPGLISDIDGERTFKGLVRDAKDAVRTYNYQWSTFVETIALQPKVPWLVVEGQIDEYEAEWQRANSANLPYLKYRQTDVDGNPAPAPSRSALQMAPDGVMQGLMLASDALKMVTGQYDASLGQKSNETSGKAILARQREGDTATYHFIDGLSMAIRHKGRILIDMIPRVYDTQRVMQILGEDNSTSEVAIDPDQQQAVRETRDMLGATKKIYNLNVGRYDVLATVGPSYTTKRQEAVDAMAQILQGNPALFQMIGDVWVRNQDWPGADEIADRLKAMLPPQVLQAEQGEQGEQGIPPAVQQQMQQMQMQMQQMGEQLQVTQGQLQEAKTQQASKAADIRLKEMDIQIKEIELEMKRVEMATKAQESEAKQQELRHETMMNAIIQHDQSTMGAY